MKENKMKMIEYDSSGKKRCSKCGQYKDIGEFNRDKNNKDGYRSECKDCRREYYETNKELIAEYKKEYRQANKELIAERDKKYQKENKDKVKVIKQRRRARKKSLPNTLTVEQWNQTLNDFNHSCANCGSNETPIHIDHFVPLSSGEKGTTVTNCIPLCSKCNCSKGSKHPLDFFSKEKAREIIDYLYTRKSQEPI